MGGEAALRVDGREAMEAFGAEPNGLLPMLMDRKTLHLDGKQMFTEMQPIRNW